MIITDSLQWSNDSDDNSQERHDSERQETTRCVMLSGQSYTALKKKKILPSLMVKFCKNVQEQLINCLMMIKSKKELSLGMLAVLLVEIRFGSTFKKKINHLKV